MKSYSRDWLVPGRVRVKLQNDDGSAANPDIPTREPLLRPPHSRSLAAVLLPALQPAACC